MTTRLRFTAESITVKTRVEKREAKSRVDGARKYNKRLNRRNKPRSHHVDRELPHKSNIGAVRLEKTLEQFEYQVDYFDDNYYFYDEYNEYDRYADYERDYWSNDDDRDSWQQAYEREQAEEAQCAICYRDFYVDQLRSQPFDKTFSYRAALVTPRAQVRLAFREEFARRYVIRGERNSCQQCLVSHLASQLQVATAYSLSVQHGLRGLRRGGGSHIALGEATRVLQQAGLPELVEKLELLTLRANVVQLARASSSPSANWQFPAKGHLLPVECVRCPMMFVVDVSESRCTHVACTSCAADICFVCRASYHFGTSCDQNEVLKNEITRGCPFCFVPIEKNGGKCIEI